MRLCRQGAHHCRTLLVGGARLVVGLGANKLGLRDRCNYSRLLFGYLPFLLFTPLCRCLLPRPRRQAGNPSQLPLSQSSPHSQLPAHGWRERGRRKRGRRERHLGRALLARPCLGARPRDQRVALHTIDLRDMSLLFELPNTVHAQHHIQESSSQSRYLLRVLLPRIMVDPGQRQGITLMGFGRTCNNRHPMVRLDAHLGP